MSSRTGKTRMARKIRQARKGKARKRQEQNKGTTPKFPIHKNKKPAAAKPATAAKKSTK